MQLAPLSTSSVALVMLVLPAAARPVQGIWEAEPIAEHVSGPGFGFVVDAVGDLDGDGAADGLISSISAGGTGRVHAISSRTGARILEVSGALAGDHFGHSVAGLGDLTGDGVADFVVGAPVLSGARPGTAVICSGATGAVVRTLQGEIPGDFFGWVVASVGDVDGDGVDDVGVGAPGHDQPLPNAGKVYVVSGADGTVLHTWTGTVQGGRLGGSVGAASDHDGDGHADVMACAPQGGGNGRGEALVWSGADAGLLRTLTPSTFARDFGDYFCGVAGDVDADGRDDLYVMDYRVGGRGRVHVFSGADGGTLLAVRGPEGQSWLFGRVRLGDYDLDGNDDLLIASSRHGYGGGNAGAVHVVSGRDGTYVARWTGATSGLALGTDVVTVGDGDGDGSPDIFAGAGGLGGASIGGAMILPTLPAPPRTICVGAPNSTGGGGTLGYSGSLSLAMAGAIPFELRAGSLPSGALAIAFGGPGSTNTPAGDGTRCVALPAARLAFGTAGAAGDLVLQPSLPVSGPAAVVAGSSWYTQVWYRDAAAGGAGFNVSAALEAVFRP